MVTEQAILKPIAQRKANRAHDFEAHTNHNIERLFTQLFEVDLLIERCAVLLNKSQPLKSGKIAVVFGVRQKLADGVRLTEPSIVRLFTDDGGAKKWTMRRISASDMAKRGKLELFLPARKKVKNAKGVWTYSAENHRQTVLLCRKMEKLLTTRETIKTVIGTVNFRTANLQRTIAMLVPKSKTEMDVIEPAIEYDFSNPSQAYAKIKQKILARK